ncbi:MAG: DegT/DnrJ/EryC1/StrS family aminotransferase [Armatimonadetes bacterium]|nr:DegT/DnrJ/EryC1/StrS family aminotransferase [Armatimonadota bacterium]
MGIPPNPTLKLTQLFRRRTVDLQGWLPQGSVYWLGRGRQAIYAALQVLQVPKDRPVLLPAYQCPAALDPYAAYQVAPVFYDLDSGLNPSLPELEQLLAKYRPGLLMLIHYYGFPVQHWERIINIATEFEVPVLEDCAHALFSSCGETPLGSQSRASIFSLSKSLATPAGGALVLNDDSAPESFIALHTAPEAGEGTGMVRLGLYALESMLPFSVRTVLRSHPWVECRVRRDMETPSEGVELCEPRSMGKWSHRIAHRSDPKSIFDRRRENYLAALEILTDASSSLVRPIFPDLPIGVCPLVCPLLIPEDRDAVMRLLLRRGIPVRALWDRLPEMIPAERFPGASYLRDHILTLPVHHGLQTEQVRKMARATVTVAGKVSRREGL